MKCPKCIDLELVEHSQEPGIYYCGNCGGHWLEYTPMESYVVEQDEMTANAFRAIWDLKSEIKSDLKCPRDQCQLNTFTYKNVELDFCMQCRGIWFDALELEGFTNRDDLEKSNSKSRLRIKRQNAAWRDSSRVNILEAAFEVFILMWK